MDNSPHRTSLYRRIVWGVICLGWALGFSQDVGAQLARPNSKNRGPRATGILQLPAKGEPRLIPVCIMIDGRFFDAGIYKADPVPMALESGTVYEAQQTGKPLGLFTIKNVLQQQQTKAWLAQGDWEAVGSAPKKSTALQAESKPREEEDRPPTLRRPAKPNQASKSDETKPPGESKPATGSPPQTATPSATSGAPSTPPDARSPNQSATPTSTSSSSSSSSQPMPAEESDPNAPRLRRGVPPKTSSASAPSIVAAAGPRTAPISSAKPALSPQSSGAKPSVQLIPAISDADGPEPRPYTYDMKPEEEQGLRKKILQLAGPEVINYAKQFEAAQEEPTRPQGKARSSSALSPDFTDVSLHVFDVSTSNEPIIVMSAKALLAPKIRKEAIASVREYYVTVVARADYDNQLRKLFASVSDNRHLDVTPRMELIDAVDADGDGRAELLFRENFDVGSAFVVYRVTPDRLWALFEGTPQ